eukprot:11115609-Ditylum_brightwellii.AAC.1
MNAIKRRRLENLEEMFKQIKSIENQYSEMVKKIVEEDKIALVLEKAPLNYAGILATTEKEKANELTMENLKEAIVIQF